MILFTKNDTSLDATMIQDTLIQNKERDLLDKETDWPGHECDVNIVVIDSLC